MMMMVLHYFDENIVDANCISFHDLNLTMLDEEKKQ